MIFTADLMDKHHHLDVASPIFKDFGLKNNFFGKIRTIKCFEDNSLVREVLETDGNNQVLVIDGNGSMNCALIGDKLAQLAIDNHWQGIIVNGCIRDSVAINQLNIGIKALATHPRKSKKQNQGEIDVVVNFAQVRFIPNHYLYADKDGIVLANEKITI